MTITCMVLRKQGRSVAVAFRDNAGMWRGAIVSAGAIGDDVKVGVEVEVPQEILKNAIEYGIDFEVLMPRPYIIDARDLQQALRDHGVWTVEDVLKRPREVVAAIQSLMRLTYADVVNRVLTIGG